MIENKTLVSKFNRKLEAGELLRSECSQGGSGK